MTCTKSKAPSCIGAQHGAKGYTTFDSTDIHQKNQAGNIPVIVSWAKVYESSKPIPTYFMTIEGSEQYLTITNVRDITDYRRFTDQCLLQLNLIFMPMKPEDWATMLKAAQPLLKERPFGWHPRRR